GESGFWGPAPLGADRQHLCSGAVVKSLLFRFLPFLKWLPRYPVKDWLIGDITSGFSVGIMHLPQGLAYALLAGLPPVNGLYSSFYPVFLYFFFGTSRHNSVGPFAVISVMIGSVTDLMVPSDDFMELVNAWPTPSWVSFQVGLGLLQFGFVVTYLSDPLVRGYTTAASVHVLISQLKYVFGVRLGEHSGPLSLFTVSRICTKLPQTNVGTLITSLIAMLVIFVVKILNHKFSSKLPMPIPIELITIIVSTGISYGADLTNKYGISVVGDIPSGLKAPVAPRVDYFARMVGNAFAIAIVGYAICISLGKIFALKHGYKVDSNQELIALGMCNFLGGFFQCFSISCSMSRSLVQESTGGNSQVAGVIASLVILITILKIGELFQQLPKAILAAIIIVNLKGMFKQFKDLSTLWKSNKVDLLIWVMTFVATLLLNLDIGLGVSVAFSLLTVIFRTQMAHYSILGQVSETDIYRDVAKYNKAVEIPGVKIFRSSATVYFANAELYTDALKKKCGFDVDRLIEKKKKALRKLKKHQKKIEKEKEKREKNCASFCDSPYCDCNGAGISVIDINGSVTEWESQNGNPLPDRGEPTLVSLGLQKPELHTVILDFSSANFVDYVCIKILKNLFRDFHEIEIDVLLVGCHESIITQLEQGNFFSQTITKHQLFASVHDAITHVTKLQGSSPPEPVMVITRLDNHLPGVV
uniref:Solute carrier family 26 member 6 n=1 Tax=Crocodylus porosus TaxID=8502 RepID=A0A7M4FN74_CROPO